MQPSLYTVLKLITNNLLTTEFIKRDDPRYKKKEIIK